MLGRALALVDGAGAMFALASDFRSNRQPRSKDLRALGLDPEDFRTR
jgi:hypothetical protein